MNIQIDRENRAGTLIPVFSNSHTNMEVNHDSNSFHNLTFSFLSFF